MDIRYLVLSKLEKKKKRKKEKKRGRDYSCPVFTIKFPPWNWL